MATDSLSFYLWYFLLKKRVSVHPIVCSQALWPQIWNAEAPCRAHMVQSWFGLGFFIEGNYYMDSLDNKAAAKPSAFLLPQNKSCRKQPTG